MSDLSKVETELVEATGISPEDYDDRQDYLAATIRGVAKLKVDAFEKLSDAAAAWHLAGVDALNAKRKDPDVELPDFDYEAEEAEESAAADEAEDEAEAEEEGTEEAEAEAAEAEDESEAEDEAIAEDEPSEKGKTPAIKKGKKKPDLPQKKGRPKPRTKLEARAKTKKEALALNKVSKPAKGGNIPPRKAEAKDRDYTKLTGERDRYGVIKGTKTAEAVAMYETGASARDIDDKIGGRHYNVLKRLQTEGHRVEKFENGKFKLTHKDDVIPKKGKGK